MLRGDFDHLNINKYFYQKNIVKNHEKLLYEIDHLIRNRTSISKSLFNSRVFINNGTRDDLGYMISNSPPEKKERLDFWLKRITGADSYCAVINGINGWSDYLAEFININFNKEWINTFGIPSNGIDVYTFIGKYEITPFGIHKDKEHTFLYHLGPGVKKAWLWDPSLCDIEPVITSNSFNLADTLSYAHAITLSPGDILFIPQNWYHVLENPEFSVTLGVAPYEKKRSELIDLFLKEELEKIDYDDSPMPLFMNHEKSLGEYSLKLLPPEIRYKELTQISNDGVNRILKKLASNHFFKYTSPIREPNNKNYRFLGGISIGDKDEKYTTIYLRGREILIKNEFREPVFKLLDIISSTDYNYKKDAQEKKDAASYYIEEMIKAGVLI